MGISFTGVNHLALVTNDMDKTIRFWRDLLGMRLVAGLGSKNYRHYFFELNDHDMIAFFEWPDVKNPEIKDHGVPYIGKMIFDHVSIGVSSKEDLWELKDKLEAAGFWVSEMIDHGFILSIYAFDPNNVPIEFSHAVKGAEIRKNPKMKDQFPAKTAMEGPLPVKGVWPEVVKKTPDNEKNIFPGEGVTLFEDDK